MHAYNGVLTILDLACFLYLVFCVSVKIKLTVSLLCVCVHSARKGRPGNDLYCVGWDVKPYSLTHLPVLLFCCLLDLGSSSCNASSLCRDVIRLMHYDTCFLVCRSQPVSWYSAAALCLSLDAEITLLFIPDIHDALLDHIRRTLQPPAAATQYWIGLRKARWIWNDTGG